jgi:preprotein translocase subunit SecB
MAIDTAPAGGPAARIENVTQYIKDMSFESPRSPASILQGTEEPHGELKVQVKVRKMGGDNYEVILQFQVESTKEDEVAFLIELHYAGVFTVTGFPEGELEPALMIECPRILYPFARRVIADVVRDGGFPQLMLGPIDFVQLYKMYGPQNQPDATKEAKETEAADA